ncbi:glutaredoxin family protein [Rappaport israeli]|uniref:glutaredoxin family protein n=1 Tax=Rappaport israeli TaxID=1839807 RepID=UPI000931C259|nr:glutaredoxin family protein [Rappaport israeli]
MITTHRLILYIRPHCHLCQHAQQILSQLTQPFELINIDQHPELTQQYNTLIPVLYAPEYDRELLYPFTLEQCQQWLNQLNVSKN